ncbi:LysE family transporter [uncultured Campylobacter sp.]|uniref:LysE family transporter n=1 Tax=uncultured Campylobacter sp. TaxID=218934 RepID=UPI0025D4A001|nr:LysE family transporter [uncultured Campylobacter sp.]
MNLLLIATIMVTHFIALIVPGPDIFLILRTSLAHGFKQSVFACLGVGAGILVWIILTAFGLKTLFTLFPPLRLILMAFSVAYLLYLSIILLNSSRKGSSINLGAKHELNASSLRFFTLGFLTNLSNPKAVLYFASIFSNFISDTSEASSVILLMTVIGVESMITFTLLGKIFSAKKAREIFLKNQRMLDGICSAVFAIFACAIFYELASEILSEF